MAYSKLAAVLRTAAATSGGVLGLPHLTSR
jgi:hypothetical protein